jgi:hypothetical protein
VNVVRFLISSEDFGEYPILRPYPRDGDSWGDLAPLRGTSFEPLVPVVSGAALSHALHGRVKPLMDEIGPHPHGLLRQVQEAQRTCRAAKDCIMRSKDCYPNPKVPGCFSPAGLEAEAQLAGALVIETWASGRYVVVVEGAEFSF